MNILQMVKVARSVKSKPIGVTEIWPAATAAVAADRHVLVKLHGTDPIIGPAVGRCRAGFDRQSCVDLDGSG